MIQNSRSPVVKSRISSSSGKTMSVEKRSLAWTGTMSSLLYLTTRAPVSADAVCAPASVSRMPAKSSTGNTCRRTVIEWDCMMFSFDLNSSFLRISFVEPTRNERREKHKRGEARGAHDGNQLAGHAKPFEDFDETGNHV